MDTFITLTARAIPVDVDNVDNDQVIPARLMRKSRLDGQYGKYLFHDLRFNDDGSEKSDYIFNHAQFRNARIVVGAKNYACGSSRLGAVYVHYDYGVRAVIAETFGDVFYNNCIKNGILPIRVSEAEAAALRSALHAQPGASIAIDLPQQTVTSPDGAVYRFDIDAFAKRCLLGGLSDITLTLEHAQEIDAFEQQHAERMSWLF